MSNYKVSDIVRLSEDISIDGQLEPLYTITKVSGSGKVFILRPWQSGYNISVLAQEIEHASVLDILKLRLVGKVKLDPS